MPAGCRLEAARQDLERQQEEGEARRTGPMKQKPKAVTYYRTARASSGKSSTHSDALGRQGSACLKKAAELGALVVASCQDDGASGLHFESRTGRQKALAEIEAGRASVIVVHDRA